jgi:ATP-binding cassette, subfamily B (MDR/TAP), member 1
MSKPDLHKQHSSHHQQIDVVQTQSDSTETLMRQVESMIQRDMSGENKLEPMVPYSKLYCLASTADKFLMWIGWISAMITGFGMPSFVFIIGDIIDSFKPTANVEDTIKTVSKMSLIFTLVGIAVWFFSYVMYSSLLLFSDRVTKKIRTKYLESILRQESAWFDTINPSELSARLSKESAAIQKALGEKMGTIVLAFAMTVAGMAFAFTRGWSFSLVLLVAFPFLGFTTSLMSKVLAKGTQETMKAYGQSAGYADQALNAIRVVAAYGQEEKEVQNYTKYLERARVAGVKTHCQGAFAMSLFFASIFGTYAYSFYMGSVWIYKDFWNNTFSRTYTAGDILSCFFGVIFGMFSVGLATPNMKAVAEGRVAGKLTFDIIDR